MIRREQDGTEGGGEGLLLLVDGRFMERWIIVFSEVEDDLFDFGGGILHFEYGSEGRIGLSWVGVVTWYGGMVKRDLVYKVYAQLYMSFLHREGRLWSRKSVKRLWSGIQSQVIVKLDAQAEQ